MGLRKLSATQERPFSITVIASGMAAFDLEPVLTAVKEYLQRKGESGGPYLQVDCSLQKRVQYFFARNPSHEGVSCHDIVVVTGNLPNSLVTNATSGAAEKVVHELGERVAIAANAIQVEIILFGQVHTFDVETQTDAAAA